MKVFLMDAGKKEVQISSIGLFGAKRICFSNVNWRYNHLSNPKFYFCANNWEGRKSKPIFDDDMTKDDMTKTTVTPYGTGDGKKAEVERMFDKIAPKYDLLNRVLSLGIDVSWRKRALGYLKNSPPQAMLDVATGTADVAILAAKMLKPGKITGIDIANQMLDLGRIKIKKAGLEQVIALETGDSEHLRFADNSFDAVTVAFGVRNFENLEKGLAEMLRVMRPGGRLVVLEFSRPHIFPFKQFYNAYFEYVLPAIGRLTSRDMRAYTYLFESVQVFPEGDNFLNILTKIGFQNPVCERLTLGICSIYSATKQ